MWPNIQFIIIGVVPDTAVYSNVQSGELRLLDVIETVNDTPIDKIFASDKDVQERFEHYIEGKDIVRLFVNHTSSLPSIAGPLSYGELRLSILNRLTKF